MKVVAGELRGRSLKAPRGDATRPTAARAKEALFAILRDVSDSVVLDLYAGSGALGIEALSRGARRAVFVESARPALACLRDNLAALELTGRAVVVASKAESAAPRLQALAPFDLVLCDPPWKDAARALALLAELVQKGLVTEGARLVLEHAAREEPPLPPGAALDVVDRRHWGDTGVLLLEPKPSPAPEHTSSP